MNDITPIGTVIIAVLILAAKVFHDWYRIEKLKKGILHGLELAIVLILYFVLWWLSGGDAYYKFTIACFFFSLYFALHDPVLNTLRGKPTFYLGTNWFDRQIAKWPHPQMRLFSFLCALGIGFVIIRYGKTL